MKKFLVLAFAATIGVANASSIFVNFEVGQGYNGSAGGTVLAGQNGWYTPSGVGTTCNTYAGNAYLSNANSFGGDQFQQGIYNANFARAQKDFAFFRDKAYSIGFETSFKFVGDPGTHVSNISSISTQFAPPDYEQLIILSAYYDDELDPTKAAAYEVLYSDVSAQIYYPVMESATFGDAQTWNEPMMSDRWYARYQLLNLPTNKVSISCVVDLTNYRHFPRTYGASEGFLTSGNTASALPPAAFRLFTGGGTGTSTTIGNLSAADNIAIMSNDVTVSGTMTHNDTDLPPIAQRVEFFDPSSGALVGHALTEVSSGDGTYTVHAPGNGVYCMSIKHSHWLRQTMMVDTTLGSVTGVDYSLTNGDADGDNEVTLVDAGLLSAAFGKAVGEEGYNPMADLNDDGEINLVDWGIFSAKFGQAGDDVCL